MINAGHFTTSDPRKLVGAVRASGVSRDLVVGGAVSLEVAPGRRAVASPGRPI